MSDEQPTPTPSEPDDAGQRPAPGVNRQPGGGPQLPMMGEARGMVRAATPVDIHGDRYVDISLLLDGEAAPLAMRIPSHLCARAPVAGDRVAMQLLMGQPQSVRFEDDPPQTG
jgi:hypothetical protein